MMLKLAITIAGFLVGWLVWQTTQMVILGMIAAGLTCLGMAYGMREEL